MELKLVVVAVLALTFIPVIIFRLMWPPSHERAINVDIVENGEPEIIRARVLALVEDD